ncbi:MAG: hypothetical protein EBS01_00055 [Verrucomicrobia bacterium]|nr:hypothetical protein [Verrucomicrobiota bacterium]
MSQSHVPSGFSPANLLWAAVAFVTVLFVCLVATSTVTPEADVDARRGALRVETRKKIQAEEAAKLSSVRFEERKGEFAKTLASVKPSASPVKVEATPPPAAGDSPALPSAPSGAVNISIPRLVTPKAPEALPEPVSAPSVQ